MFCLLQPSFDTLNS